MIFEGQIFCDLDGVLVNFDKGIYNILGKYPKDISDAFLWKTVYSTPNFFYNLDWMPDGKELWDYIELYDPPILTGLPGKDGKQQKIAWVDDQIGSHVNVIVCKSREKCLYAQPGDILIDDRTKYRHLWEEKGGIFIHHLNTRDTIKQLKKLGI